MGSIPHPITSERLGIWLTNVPDGISGCSGELSEMKEAFDSTSR